MNAKPPLLGVDEALQRILAAVPVLASETVALEDACGRTLAQDVVASLDQPPFSASSMDGYAVRAADLTTLPVVLTVIGESAAGHPFTEALPAASAVRIFTGATVPQNANAIVIQEDATRDGETITVSQAVTPGTYIRPAGGDFQAGTVLLSSGTRLTSRSVMLAAANGVTELEVVRQPRVGILATGDEVVPPGATRTSGQIFSSVPAGLAPLVRHFGGTPVLLGIAADTTEALQDALARASTCDVLVTIGGASVGDHDLVHGALEAFGVSMDFWKIAMRPGKPLMFGQKTAPDHHLHVLGLPGNPVSGMVCGRIFLAPLLAALMGQTTGSSEQETLSLPLAAPLPQNGIRRHYMRGRYVFEHGTRAVVPAESQDSSLMRLLAEADCLIVRRRGEKAAQAGDVVEVLPLDF